MSRHTVRAVIGGQPEIKLPALRRYVRVQMLYSAPGLEASQLHPHIRHTESICIEDAAAQECQCAGVDRKKKAIGKRHYFAGYNVYVINLPNAQSSLSENEAIAPWFEPID